MGGEQEHRGLAFRVIREIGFVNQVATPHTGSRGLERLGIADLLGLQHPVGPPRARSGRKLLVVTLYATVVPADLSVVVFGACRSVGVMPTQGRRRL
ncbi:hypothetical protein FEAC_15000 [Ferrimicrobium acidiphilum DSM 19497]|uniref:Uncharacterized protein n=1 Tax=Ferrimicrobium acidiphilum DSM 19497 TaxID=1121877 RepID=A0A0D8FTX3_9ACTN|nr:hypothetical protein FEAC_15000 [Ferrimicrobium acidiphilum DSM 19497]